MMRRRTAVALLAGVLLAGLVAVPGAPAGAQDIADLPRLGYEIDPTRGHVGDEVHSQVDPGDVFAACYSMGGATIFDWEEVGGDIPNELMIRSFFMEVFMYTMPATWYEQLSPLAPELIAGWEQIHGPIPETDVGEDILIAAGSATPPEGIPDDQDGQNFVRDATMSLRNVLGLFGSGELSVELYPELFVTTFVDPVTQEMVGETGNFDPDTGEGTMLVPGLEPGLYAVAAACAALPSYEQFPELLDAALVAGWEWSVENDLFPTGSPSLDAQIEWGLAGGWEVMFGEILVPRAVGIDFYCVLQDDGYCATPPGPVGLIDDAVLDEFNGDGDLVVDDGGSALQDVEGVEGLAGREGLAAVGAAPTFTG